MNFKRKKREEVCRERDVKRSRGARKGTEEVGMVKVIFRRWLFRKKGIFACAGILVPPLYLASPTKGALRLSFDFWFARRPVARRRVLRVGLNVRLFSRPPLSDAYAETGGHDRKSKGAFSKFFFLTRLVIVHFCSRDLHK